MECKLICRRPTWKEQRYFPQRYVVTLLAFLGMTVNYLLRININLAIVAMVRSNHAAVKENSTEHSETNECSHTAGNDTSTEDYDGEFEWDEFTQSLILGSLFWGYLWSGVPGGRLAEMFGPRLVLGLTLTLSAVLTLLIPLAANLGYVWLMVIRILIGLSQGGVSPCSHALISAWCPPEERSTMVALIYSGGQVGTVLGFGVTGLIISCLGWEAVFYIEAAITLVWALVWLLVVSDKPSNNRWITDVEKQYIQLSLGDNKEKKSPPVPWRKIVTSLPVWAILISAVGNNWGFYTLLTDLPLYMKEMMKVDMKENALLSAMPYVGTIVFGIFVSNLSDYLMRKRILSTVVVRKLANSIAHYGPAVCLFCLTLMECDRTATVAMLFLAVALQGALHSGFVANHLDIAPNFAGTLYGFTNTFASVPAFLAPMTVGALTNGQQTLGQWRKVFYITAAIYLVDATFYVFLASGKEQSWNSVVECHEPIVSVSQTVSEKHTKKYLSQSTELKEKDNEKVRSQQN